ncbi:phosphate ABC transporter permease subunit PstC [Desulfurivibrio alkaliphilus]|uniref:Phosphate transport system permease protein n=1 Tax=Desulfurivibrio alkaliphilus (strain DSM 19089 / UNIQEM U267 / AHT2) TaxID=589865 RepID=D6Z1H8_DESAT|nr:phosphate ABC transporter permease subunit PstC [Desulfurivibrio alkaliphilus]ADH87312.1 phosphate ABC transporter, inner membrane subunit PstC [Desulfurivibrio alkaliphilus AHT 2]
MPRFNHRLEQLFAATVTSLTVAALLTLLFIIGFILKESLLIFQQVAPLDFLFGREWRPLSPQVRLGLWPFLTASLAVTALALLLALPVAIGAALFLAFRCPPRLRRSLLGLINLLAGIPSVIYGFIGIMVLLPLFERWFGMSSGDSLLAGGIVLAVMILPFIIATSSESMAAAARGHLQASRSLGVSQGYMLRNLVLPAARFGILAGSILGVSRAMGETMAVMMVVGNSPLPPTALLERVQPIPSLIALEIGSAPLGSLHYHALFGAALVLLLMLLAINLFFYFLRQRLSG